jgi:4-carboxymuconolactone decarboxylase
MKSLKFLLFQTVFVCCFFNELHAQQPMDTIQLLDSKQQSIVIISAFTTNGDLLQLQQALNDGLNAGLTINDIKEVLVQLYAYAGFPRSLNALQTLMDVLTNRKQKGIEDEIGKEPSPLPDDKSRLEFGTEMQTKLIGQPIKGDLYEFAPAIDQFLKEHLFGDIFGRNNIDWKTRELATIAALATLGNVENQLRSHFNVGMYNGLTSAQLDHVVSIIQTRVGFKEGVAAKKVLQSVLNQNKGIKIVSTDSIYSVPEKMMIRIAEIEIHADKLEQYKAILKEEAMASVKLEPGVISIFPMYQNTNPTQVRILEIYANRKAYESHLATPHFQKYKTSTPAMVKSLKLIDMEAIDASTMTRIFSKIKSSQTMAK